MFNQLRILLAQIRTNYNVIEQDNEKLRKAYTQLSDDYQTLRNKYNELKNKLNENSNTNTTESSSQPETNN